MNIDICVSFVCRTSKRMVRKKKWTTVMDLKVQDLPGKDIFSSIDLNWSEVVKGDKSIDRVALIPYSRVPDFIKGEEMNPNAPCKFV